MDLDDSVEIEDIPLPVIDCSGCLAPCCKELGIIEVDPDELNGHMIVYPCSNPDPEVYILQRREDGACIHLTDDNRCGIYEHRPMECRYFDCRGDERFSKRNRGADWVGYQQGYKDAEPEQEGGVL